jgi:nucleotide-binding universal stress UspA family protein
MDQHDLTVSKNIILVPTDFSLVCGHAVHYASKLAQILDCRLVILHVIDINPKDSGKTKKAGTEYINERLSQYKALHEKEYGIIVETLVKAGTIFTSINKTATDLDARLMVMGTHGKKGLQYLTGSDILKVSDRSPVPVIVVQNPSFQGKYEKILIPLTHELHPDKKIAWAGYFSRIFNASIHLYQYFYKDKQQNDRLLSSVEKITRSFVKDKIPYLVSKAEKENKFSTQVISYAKSQKCDLIMIIDVNYAKSSLAWFESLLFNKEGIPVMTINLARIKKSNS